VKKFSLKSLNPEVSLNVYAWGWLWSVWPMIGVRYVMAIAFFALFKMPQSVALITNYVAMVPFFLLYFPHLRLGEWLWGAERLNYNFSEMWDYVSTDPFGSVGALLPSIGHAITGWLVLTPLHFATGYAVFYVWFRVFKKSKR
jgi:uncharacterized protein (DUF2062 family)